MNRLRRWVRTLIALMPLCAACYAPVPHQQDMQRLSQLARRACEADKAHCPIVKPCQDGTLAAARGWQKLTEALARGESGAALERDALLQEGIARTTCALVGVR